MLAADEDSRRTRTSDVSCPAPLAADEDFSQCSLQAEKDLGRPAAFAADEEFGRPAPLSADEDVGPHARRTRTSAGSQRGQPAREKDNVIRPAAIAAEGEVGLLVSSSSPSVSFQIAVR